MKIITLNIQGGFKINQVCQETKEKFAPLDLLCLQEVCESQEITNHAQQIAESLGRNYASKSFLPIDFKVKSMGNAFVFNKKSLNLLDSHCFTLPGPILNFPWKILNHQLKLTCDRLCFTGLFQTKKGLKIRVSNVHLDSAGGTPTRKRQIKFILKILATFEKTRLEFILGDFNTFNLTNKSFSELNLIQKKGFKDLTKNIPWTASPSNPDPAWKESYFLMRSLKPFSFLFRKKMDYIFGKGKIINPPSLAISFNSTDHQAIVIEFNI